MDLTNLPIEEILSIDLESIGVDIELLLGERIAPPPKGIYIYTKLEPIMKDGEMYYHKDGDKYVQVDDINKLKTSIYNSDYRVIIPKSFMLNKERYLSNESLLPYRGIKIAELLIKDHVFSLLEYSNRTSNLHNQINSHLINVSDETVYTEIISKLDDIIPDLIYTISMFINKHTWHIYTIRIKDKMLRIEKNADWRVVEYYRLISEDDSK